MGPYRILDAAISPDGKRMVSVGRAEVAAPNGSHGSTASAGSSDTGHRTQPPIRLEWRLHVYDLGSRARMR